ncbi:hypothetical protein [Helicobacter sp. MIT 11-5569]|nr:hypothetical protein [Helicobacter sp. MIT 11-5569]
MAGAKQITREIYQGILKNTLDSLEEDNPYIQMLPDEAIEQGKNEN